MLNKERDDDRILAAIYMKMIDYLSRGDMAEERLVDRIYRLKLRYPRATRYALYTRENARRVLPLLRERGFLDEKRYARNVLTALLNRKDGIRMIRRKMLQRRIRPSIVEEAIRNFAASGAQQDRAKIALALDKKREVLMHKYRGDPARQRRIPGMLRGWLMMRGYTSEEIASLMKHRGCA